MYLKSMGARDESHVQTPRSLPRIRPLDGRDCCSRHAVQGRACAVCKHHNSQLSCHPGQPEPVVCTRHDERPPHGNKRSLSPSLTLTLTLNAVGVRDVVTQMRTGQLVQAR